VKGLKYGDVDESRLWYSLEVAFDQADAIACETGVRQRVKRIQASTNVFRCTWLIEEI
jgi:hypothetical protein